MSVFDGLKKNQFLNLFLACFCFIAALYGLRVNTIVGTFIVILGTMFLIRSSPG